MKENILADEEKIYEYFLKKREEIESEITKAKSKKQHDIATAKMFLLCETMGVVYGIENKES